MQAQASIARSAGDGPHYSRMSIGAYYQKIEEAQSPIEIARIERWHLLPSYLDALADRVRLRCRDSR